MSSPTTSLVTKTSAISSLAQTSPTIEDAGVAVQMDDGEEGDKRSYTEVARDGISTARDALLGTGLREGYGGSSVAGKERKEEGWAPGLFYAYARRVGFFFRFCCEGSGACSSRKWHCCNLHVSYWGFQLVIENRGRFEFLSTV